MLDQHVSCDIIGYSPEDDLCPKLRIRDETIQMGGAGNVAANLISLGCTKVHLCGQIGDDQEGDILRELFEIAEIKTILSPQEQTTTKTRFLTPRGRHAARIDREAKSDLSYDETDKIIRQIKDINPDIILVSDYAKGMVTNYLMHQINYIGPKVIVDPKHQNLSHYGAPYCITPNQQEAQACIKKQGHMLSSSENIIITKGGDGCEIIGTAALPVRRREVGDPTGCGDSFLAALGISTALNMPIISAATYAACAGACAMDHSGTYAVTNRQWISEIRKHHRQFSTHSEIPVGLVSPRPQ